MSKSTIHLGDCIEILASLPSDSIDACVCDPPYGLADAPIEKISQCLTAWLDGRPFSPRGAGFMGHDWDAWVPGPEIWREVLRVLKPGGHLLAFAGTRMHDLMSLAIRLAGFELRDEIALQWSYGQGFAKSVNAGRAIDMELCTLPGRHCDKTLPKECPSGTTPTTKHRRPDDHLCPAHALGDPWRGQGTALKPSYEPIVLARKPFPASFAQTVLEHGTALAIDACRVGTSKEVPASPRRAAQGAAYGDLSNAAGDTSGFDPNTGRWPPNMLLVHHPDCERVGTRRVKTGTAVRKHGRGGRHFGGAKHSDEPEDDVTFADADGYEEIPKFRCAEGCPVRAMDGQSGILRSGDSDGFVGADVATNQSMGAKRSIIRPENIYADEGGASRFFPTFCYAPKVSKSERNAGCEGLPARGDGRSKNDHPTLKPVDLMRWLVRLVTPSPDAVVLDPFMGSGSTGVACIAERKGFIGIEKDPGYYTIARARIEWAQSEPVDEGVEERPPRPPPVGQQDLFR